MFVSIFHGRARGLGEDPQKSIYMQVGVGLRKHLHHFKGAQLSVFMAICLHANEAGEAFPSYEVLEKETGYGSDTIAKALDKLCQLEIEGDRVLVRRRERDDKGKYVGGNHYLIFPTAQEVQMWEIPDVGKPKHKKNQTPKEEPITSTTLRANNARAEPPQASLFGTAEPLSSEQVASTKKPRKPDPILDTIVSAFNVPMGQAVVIKQQVLGKIPESKPNASCNFSPPATEEELREFPAWYKQKYPQMALPLTDYKFQRHFYEMRQGKAAAEQAKQPRFKVRNGRVLKYDSDMKQWFDIGPEKENVPHENDIAQAEQRNERKAPAVEHGSRGGADWLAAD